MSGMKNSKAKRLKRLTTPKDPKSLFETSKLLAAPGLLKSVRKAKQQIRKGETYSVKEVFG